jgi:hypothetical protein
MRRARPPIALWRARTLWSDSAANEPSIPCTPMRAALRIASISAAAVTGSTRRWRKDGNSRPTGGQHLATRRATGTAAVMASRGTSNHFRVACHRATAVRIFAADESGTLAFIAFATCNNGLMRSIAAPAGGANRGVVFREVVIDRTPCAVSTSCPADASCDLGSALILRSIASGDNILPRLKFGERIEAADEAPKL